MKKEKKMYLASQVVSLWVQKIYDGGCECSLNNIFILWVRLALLVTQRQITICK